MCRRCLLLLVLLMFLGCSIFEEKKSKLCFVGDSITHLWDLDYYFPNYITRKHAVSGASVKDIDDWNVSDCAGYPTVLLIGTNDIGFMKSTDVEADWISDEFVEKYIVRAKRLNADPLIAISILPRNFEGKQDSTTNIYLQMQNEKILNALDTSGIEFKFVDVFDAFLKKNFQLREDVFKDGLHPNEEGYEILTRKVQGVL